MPVEPDEVRDAFLEVTRLCILTTFGKSGGPISVPVWFEWDGAKARIFANASSPKVKKLENDPQATLLIVNNVGEPEYWVRIEGTVAICEDGAADLATRLADRYWDMSTEEHKTSVESWVAAAANLRVLELTPAQVRTYGG